MTETQALFLGSRPGLNTITRNASEAPCFVIGDNDIDIVRIAKYLGVILDQHFIWDEHTTLLQTKISCSLGFLKSAKKFLLWGNCGESKKKVLQKMQNREAWIATNPMAFY